MEDRIVQLPLTALKDGETGIITSIASGSGRRRGRAGGRGWGFQKRLMDMGLTPGTTITVVKSAPFRGPVEILVRGSRLALGRGMAERVLVETNK
ncbi:MAG: ferrous iron transport protein A [Candidatus Bathyarchaeia archaeon]